VFANLAKIRNVLLGGEDGSAEDEGHQRRDDHNKEPVGRRHQKNLVKARAVKSQSSHAY
jgi:hypothetical protein